MKTYFLFSALCIMQISLATEIHDACYTGNQEQLTYMLKHDASRLHERDHNGNTPLHIAAYYNNINILHTLLASYQADPWYYNYHNATAIHIAIDQHHHQALRMLLAYIQNHHITDHRGISLIAYAVNDPEIPLCIINTLLCYSTRTNKDDGLMRATLQERYDIVRMLLQHNSCDMHETVKPALHTAAEKNYINLAILLLSYGCDPQQEDITGHSLSFQARSRSLSSLIRHRIPFLKRFFIDSDQLVNVVLPALCNGNVSQAGQYLSLRQCGYIALGQGWITLAQRIYETMFDEHEKNDMLLHALARQAQDDTKVHPFIRQHLTSKNVRPILLHATERWNKRTMSFPMYLRIYDDTRTYMTRDTQRELWRTMLSYISRHQRNGTETPIEIEHILTPLYYRYLNEINTLCQTRGTRSDAVWKRLTYLRSCHEHPQDDTYQQPHPSMNHVGALPQEVIRHYIIPYIHKPY